MTEQLQAWISAAPQRPGDDLLAVQTLRNVLMAHVTTIRAALCGHHRPDALQLTFT